MSCAAPRPVVRGKMASSNGVEATFWGKVEWRFPRARLKLTCGIWNGESNCGERGKEGEGSFELWW